MSAKDISDEEVCRATVYAWEDGIYIHWALRDLSCQSETDCIHAIERAYRRGFLDYDVSLWEAWLTDRGKQLLCNEDCERLQSQDDQ
jgi:hypothetical protein